MVVLSFLLVIVAAVTLIIGLFQDTLAWIWTSIGSCVVAMIFLGIGVLQRRGRQPEAAGGPAYGHGAAPSAPSAPSATSPDQPVDVSAAPKRTADEARAAVEATEGSLESAAAREPERARFDETPTQPDAGEPVAAEVTAAAEEASADAAPPVMSPAEQRTTWAPAEGTTGARARAALAEVKGLGPAKQEALLERFGSLEAIAAASRSELLKVRGIGQRVADEIRSTLRSADF